MKKIITTTLVTSLVLSSMVFAAGEEVTVMLNGKNLDFKDAKPTIVNGRTLVPVSSIADNLNIPYEWNGSTKTVTFKTEDQILDLQIGEKESQIIDNRTYVPIAYIAKSFGQEKVDWDGNTKTVYIWTKAEDAEKPNDLEEVKPIEETTEKPVQQPPVEQVKKPYTELKDKQSKSLSESGLQSLNKFELYKYKNKPLPDKVYEITKTDLPIQLGDVVITDIEINSSIYNREKIFVSGYVLEERGKDFSGASLELGFVDKNGTYRARKGLATGYDGYQVYKAKYPNIKICQDFEKNLFLTKTKPGEKFTFAYLVYDADDYNYGIIDKTKFTRKDIEKVVIYNSYEEADILVVDKAAIK